MPGTFETLWRRRWWLSGKNCYGRWNLGTLPPAGNQESEQEMAPYLLTKTEQIPHTTICGKGYANSILGWTRGNFGALHSQGEHCDQCNVCRYPNESRASCNSSPNDVDVWVQAFCSNVTIVGPIMPSQLLQQSKICLSNVFQIRRTRQTSPSSDFHVFGPLKGAMGGKYFRSDEEVQKTVHVWLRSQPKYIFFLEVCMHFRSTGALVWNAMETT